jgi:hypothetical protein
VIYCEQCGAANDILATICIRCGSAITNELESLAPAAAFNLTRPLSEQTAAGAPQNGLAADLELPGWLQVAAAETPHDPGSSANADAQLPPAGFVFEQPADVAAPPFTAKPSPGPVPEWLRATGTQTASPSPAEVTDTSGFITENDLPDWIRQIAVADAAKKVEEQKRAAEEELAAGAEATGKKAVMPGEDARAPQATNPWLTRREGGAAASAWGGNQVAQPVENVPALEVAAEQFQAELASAAVAPAEPVKSGKKRGKLAVPSISNSTLPKVSAAKPTMPKLSLPSVGSGRKQATMRLVLIGAVVLVVLALLITVVF